MRPGIPPMNPPQTIRSRRRRWAALGLIAIVAAAFVGLQLGRGPSAVERWMDSQRARGERFTLAELEMDQRPPLASPVLDAIDAAQPAVVWFHRLNPDETLDSSGRDGNVPRVLWQQPGVESVAGLTAHWEVMHDRLDKVETALADLRHALRHQVPDPGGNYSHLTGGPRPNFVAMRTAAQVLADAVVIELHRGNTDRALANLVALIQLAGQHAELYTLVHQMIRIAITGLALDSTWQALQWTEWNEAELALVQAELEQLTLLPGVLRCLEIERAMGLEVFDLLQETLSGPAATAMGSGFLNRIQLWAWRGLWSRRDLLFYLHAYQNGLDGLREWNDGAAMIPVGLRLATAAEEEKRRVRQPFRYPGMVVSAFALPNLQRVVEVAFRTETRRRLAVVAVGLGRFRLLHGRYPDELAELVPAFLAVLPADPYTAQPFGYRLTDAEHPRLWSVGADGVDDGGTIESDEVWLLPADPEALP